MSKFALAVVVWTIQSVNYLDLVVEDGHAFSTYFLYSSFTLSKILTKLIPLCFLISIILTILRLEKDNELIILWSSGLNKIYIVNLIFRISLIIMFLQLLLTVVMNPLLLNFSRSILKNSELGFDIFFANGHTEKQMIPHIQYKGKTIVFAAGLLPTVGHIPLPYVMGYDTRPLLTMDEKAKFLNQAADNNYVIFLEHDATYELCTVKHTEKGVRLNQTYKFNEVFN